jgi:pectate lyase
MTNPKKIISLLLFVLLISIPAFALTAFPGAEGMGASSVGGRGGTVLFVTNLNDSGSGSFRAAVEATGRRIVLFKVSGHIRLATTLYARSPYITIVGQTSPGGVDVSGGMFCVSTHDVVVMHMRFRMGSDVCDGIARSAVGNCETYGDTVRVMGDAASGDHEAYNVVFDHCSMSWGNDETLDIGGYQGNTRDVVISWCIIAQGLDDPAPEDHHAYGIDIGSHFQASGLINVSLHHNYIAHFRYRVPLVAYNGFCDGRNNVVYNWEPRQSMELADVSGYTGTKANFISNYMKNGTLGSGATCGSGCSGIFYCGINDKCDPNPTETRKQIYASGNTGCAGDAVWTGWGSSSGWVSSGFLASSAHTTTDIPVTTSTMNATYAQTVLSGAGATKPVRDSVDAGFVNDFNNGTGSVLADRHYPTGYPTFSTPVPPVDSDNDGMPDSWETVKGLNPAINDSASDINNNGYTNIEEYIFELGGYSASSPAPSDTTPPSSPKGVSVKVK